MGARECDMKNALPEWALGRLRPPFRITSGPKAQDLAGVSFKLAGGSFTAGKELNGEVRATRSGAVNPSRQTQE